MDFDEDLFRKMTLDLDAMMVDHRNRREAEIAKRGVGANQHIKDAAVETGTIDGVEYWIVPSPMYKQWLIRQAAERPVPYTEVDAILDRQMSGLNGYACFKEKPVVEPDYHGILEYVPVHGGITYCEHDELGSVYGFDTGHCDSEEFPRTDHGWIRDQISIMIHAIRMAADIEQEYLAADGNNERRAEIVDPILALQRDQQMNFQVMINLLGGEL